MTGLSLGRPEKDVARYKTQDFFDECERVEVEHGSVWPNASVFWA